jgi:hypothetical protein
MKGFADIAGRVINRFHPKYLLKQQGQGTLRPPETVFFSSLKLYSPVTRQTVKRRKYLKKPR